MTNRTVLLTSHKGVDLHAATAVRVMRDRLAGGDRLAALHRCEFHVLSDGTDGWTAARLLDTGRFFNPNKHHYGLFAQAGDGAGDDTGTALPAGWPGVLLDTDLEALAGDANALYDLLLGGAPAIGCTAVDVASWSRDAAGPVISGVLWRLVMQAEPAEAGTLAESLAVARTRKEGMLLNPHMEAWRTAVRTGPGRETP